MSTRRRRSLGDEIELKEDDVEEEEVRVVDTDPWSSISPHAPLLFEHNAFYTHARTNNIPPTAQHTRKQLQAEVSTDEDVEDDVDGSEDEEEQEEISEDERPHKRSKKFVAPPPGRDLPARASRGQRMGTLVAVAQDDDADEEFWNQDFFKEEEEDIRYETESEPEDDADADFSESEEEIDSDEEAAEAEADAQARDKKKKVLRPPGYKPPPVPGATLKSKPKSKSAPTSAEKKQQKQVKVKKEKIDNIIDDGIIIPVERTVMVRESTRQKVLEGEEERRVMEAVKPRRTSKPTVVRQLTQQELLAEAAYTEIENLKSLELLEAAEEATKKKANVKKARYAGPMLRVVSRKDRTTQEERTTIEVRNMAVPPELVPRRGPPGDGPVPRAVCAISGLPAKYKDPFTKMPYANVEAFKELRSRVEKGLIYVK